MTMKPRLFIEVLVFAVATAACGSEPTDENVSFAEAIVQGAVTESSGAPVVGAVVWVLQNESLGRECTGEYGG